MKVESLEKKNFEQITITLETKEDFENFWHLTRVEKDESLEKYCRDKGKDIEKIDTAIYGLWYDIDSIADKRGYDL